MSLHLIKTRLNLIHRNFLTNLKCKNELIYIRDFEAVQKTRSHVLSGLKPRGKAKSFLT